MAVVRVRFEWLTGLRGEIFRNLRLLGSWDRAGNYSNSWTTQPMTAFTAEDGCPAWWAEVDLAEAEIGWTFHWGVVADGPQSTNAWAIPTEVPDPHSNAQHCSFALAPDGGTQRYYLTHCRRLGANKIFAPGTAEPAIRFSVWAPNSGKVEIVTGDLATGYIFNDGRGVKKTVPLVRGPDPGIWQSEPSPKLARFADWDHTPYMVCIERDDGSIRYRTDLFSRCQIGSGDKDPEPTGPAKEPWDGTRGDLKATKSCSVVIDPERVTGLLEEGVFPETRWLSESAFWAEEYDPLRPVPDRLEELVIYEMHVEGLGAGNPRPGTFRDAITLLDQIVDLGVNAIELLPIGEAEAWTWHYGTSHHFATDYAGGGRDQFKHFVRACHQRGIAVLLDVVYNHYVEDAVRAQWLYDTASHSRSAWYWYEGRESDWPEPDGGYLDNGSTGFTPNFRAEMVRKLFISSAAMLMSEFHVDGFRVDLTQAIHRDNVLHATCRCFSWARRWAPRSRIATTTGCATARTWPR